MLVKEVRALLEGKNDDDVFQVSVTELPSQYHVSINVIKPVVEGNVEAGAEHTESVADAPVSE